MMYLYIKSFHLIFLIAWMVSLLYLPRLFVYHSDVPERSSRYTLLLLMEKRLIKIIAIPAMFLTLFFGFILLYLQPELISEIYFIIKIFFVFLLVVFQIYLIFVYSLFRERQNTKSGKFYRDK